jgi:hypothetical protein
MTILRPTKFPEWATVPSTDPIVGGPNVQEPPTLKKQKGWERKEKPPANYQNWLHNLANEWLEYLAETSHDTGDIMVSFRTSKTGWVLMDDGTIGNGSSGATTRANDDTEALFTVLWDNVIDTWCPVSGGRGASAAADFAANKTLTLPQALGRALASAGTGSGLTARALGENLGEEAHQLTVAELAAHDHPPYPGTSFFQMSGGNINVGAQEASTDSRVPATGSRGGDTPHNTMQPTIFANVFIKL